MPPLHAWPFVVAALVGLILLALLALALGRLLRPATLDDAIRAAAASRLEAHDAAALLAEAYDIDAAHAARLIEVQRTLIRKE
jgi:hypothetical protein